MPQTAGRLMTRLLVSVRSVGEARDALAGGADLIDLKEPRHGSLGAVDAKTAAAVARAVGDRAPLSVAAGELKDLDRSPCEACLPASAVPEKFAYAKLGLAGCVAISDWRRRWSRWRESLPAGVAPVAVVYADWRDAAAPPPDDVLDFAAAVSSRAVLVDTHGKLQGDLLQCFPLPELGEFVARIRRHRLLSVLAGSLTYEALPQVLRLQPDFIAVRGAVCRGGRGGIVDKELVRKWADRLLSGAGSNSDAAPFA